VTKKIAIHSYRGGTGKSNISANLSAVLAQSGKRVGVVDTDIQSPGVNVLFGREDVPATTLNDYLWGLCPLKDAVLDLSTEIGIPAPGKLFLLPSSLDLGKITRILKEGYDVGVLNDGFNEMSEAFDLDYLIIDTHPGLNEETLLSLAISDVSLVVLRADNQDYLGTSVTVEVARKLEVRDLRLVLNMVPQTFDERQVKDKVEQTYDCPCAQIFGHYDDVRSLASQGLMALKCPSATFSQRLRQLADAVR